MLRSISAPGCFHPRGNRACHETVCITPCHRDECLEVYLEQNLDLDTAVTYVCGNGIVEQNLGIDTAVTYVS